MQNKTAAIMLGFSAVILAIAGYLFWRSQNPETVQPAAVVEPAAGVSADSTPENKVKYPVEEEADDEAAAKPAATPAKTKGPLPNKTQVGEEIQQKWSEFFGSTKDQDVMVFENLVDHIVGSFENATGKQFPPSLMPVEPAQGELIVKTVGTDTVLSEENYARYNPYMAVLMSADFKKIVRYYSHVYPVFQSAYAELGRPGYFNDRVIEVIDEAIDTPEIKKPIVLIKENSRYKFAESDLEELSAIQKVLIRMGPEHAITVKSKLKELRAALTHVKK